MPELPDGTSYVAIGNDELGAPLKSGESMPCPKGCGESHVILGGKDKHGNETDMILAYRCGDKVYLCGVGGRRTKFKGDRA